MVPLGVFGLSIFITRLSGLSRHLNHLRAVPILSQPTHPARSGKASVFVVLVLQRIKVGRIDAGHRALNGRTAPRALPEASATRRLRTGLDVGPVRAAAVRAEPTSTRRMQLPRRVRFRKLAELIRRHWAEIWRQFEKAFHRIGTP